MGLRACNDVVGTASRSWKVNSMESVYLYMYPPFEAACPRCPHCVKKSDRLVLKHMTNVSESLKQGRVYEVRLIDLILTKLDLGKHLSFGVPLWILG